MALPKINEFSLNPDVIGGVLIVADQFKLKKGWNTVTIGLPLGFPQTNRARVYDECEFDVNISNASTLGPEIFYINSDQISIALTRTNASAFAIEPAKVRISDASEYAYRDTTNNLECFDDLEIGDNMVFRHYLPKHTFGEALDYININTDFRYKHVESATINVEYQPVEALLERVIISSSVAFRFTNKTENEIVNIIHVKENFDHIHMPKSKNVVYHIDYENFTKFIKLNPTIAQNLSFGSAKENKVILIDDSNKVKIWPGTEYVEESFLETKSFYIEHGVLQKFLMDFEDPKQINKISSLVKNADKIILNKENYENIKANKWKGIANRNSRGYALSFLIRNIENIKHFIFRFKTRLRE